ncbi:MAG: mechanosensitive ion channel family protein, partial [Candidatus ainarchaeum sp.]|nr:mechanosensitive ion channel family protein [Candidatus ainarchaeum sp.]
FLNIIYFGNPLLNWIYFFLTIIIFFLITKTIIYFSKGLGRKITKKTKEDIDAKIIDMIEEPLAFVMIIIGIYLGSFFLVLDTTINFYFINIIKILTLIAVVWIIIRLIDITLDVLLKPIIGKTKTKYDDQIVQLLSKLFKIMAIILALIIALDSFGIDVFTLVAGLGIGGLAFAFAAQKTISNAFGGLTILFSRPFILGDTIEFGSNLGTVEEISIMHTRIRNLEKRIVTVPNSKLAESITTNISSATKRKTVWKIGVTYNTPLTKIEKAKKIIINAIESCELCDKEPIVAFDEFANSSLNILVLFFTKTGSWGDMVKAKDEIGLKIKKEFEKNKIEFAFPTQTIYLEK